ncbi:hypothetical protein F4810DRAFT_590433 [Camillea tinctor]|nr:hypothetical protein F4810DRAFT_590433 [Camillea tinctor]
MTSLFFITSLFLHLHLPSSSNKIAAQVRGFSCAMLQDCRFLIFFPFWDHPTNNGTRREANRSKLKKTAYVGYICL